MCGIAGIWGENGADGVETVRTMMHRVAHRGPDQSGLFRDGGGGVLGHRRLSIMDPAGGKQPIAGAGPRTAIVANGEIYNYRTLKRACDPEPPFRTGSDSEVLVRLYEALGTEAPARFEGMYAFAIADGDALFAARDPVGIKPLYFGRRDGALHFASEIKALAGIAGEVREFPPGTWFHSDRGFHSFHEIPERSPAEWPAEEAARELRETMERAVSRRLMSDVPLGAFLSGGLDSSIIAALARRHMDELHTFSVGVEGSPDLAAARRVARHLDTVHHERTFDRQEVAEALPEIVYHLESYDRDLVRSAIPTYFTAGLAAEHVKVILTGEGADELFAGYRYYRDFEDPEALHEELRRSVRALHDINLQRVDRLTMAHGIEGRVPFLDLEMIELAQRIAPGLKLRRTGSGSIVEKWILREAFGDLLPPEIVWRDKEQFDEGSGTVELVGRGLERLAAPGEIAKHRSRYPDADLRDAEETVYHRLLVDAYEHPEPVLENVARWADRPAAGA